jgi:plasmid stabilization system protein ParE
VTFEVSKRARRQIERIQAWWIEHRPAARGLFLEELAVAEQQLRAAPEVGSTYMEHPGGAIRRLLLPRTHHHLYYRHQPDREVLTVLAVWGSPRGRGPRL